MFTFQVIDGLLFGFQYLKILDFDNIEDGAPTIGKAIVCNLLCFQFAVHF